MSTSKSQFIREYQRASKSPWDDNSTILLLADVDEASTSDSIELSFSHYIYMHRDRVGSVLGISISLMIILIKTKVHLIDIKNQKYELRPI